MTFLGLRFQVVVIINYVHMKIESLQFYNEFGCHVPCNCPEQDFESLPHIANYIRDCLVKLKLHDAMVWVDNQRYIYVTLKTYDVHYHGFFNNFKSQTK